MKTSCALLLALVGVVDAAPTKEELIQQATQGADTVRMVTEGAYAEDYKAGKLDEMMANNFLEAAEKCVAAVTSLLADPATAGTKLDLNGVKDLQPIKTVRDQICQPAIAEAKKAQLARMESVVWPGDAKVANGAGLKAATLAWWKAHNGDIASANRVEKAQVVAVAVRGDWTSGATNDFGETTRWDVPVWVAVTNDKLRADDIAMVYDCSMVTKEQRNVKRALPFANTVYGAPFRMRLSKVKK